MKPIDLNADVGEGFDDSALMPHLTSANVAAGGHVRSRALPGALITDPQAAAAQALRLAPDVQTLCVHSDTPGAAAIAAAVRPALQQAGYRVAPLEKP